MNIVIHSPQLSVTPPLKDYSLRKFSKICNKSQKLQDFHLKFSSQRYLHQAEAHYRFEGVQKYAKALGKNLLSSIDRLQKKILHQILKEKHKHEASHGGKSNLTAGP